MSGEICQKRRYHPLLQLGTEEYIWPFSGHQAVKGYKFYIVSI